MKMPGVTKTGTKIFVGNLSNQVTSDDVRKLFEEIGEVTECDILKNYGFVHMDSPETAEKAIDTLNGRSLYGQNIVVEASTNTGRKDGGRGEKGIKRGGTKIFIGNLPMQATPDYIRKKFEEFGTVMECDILKNYGFVHLDTPENAQKAIAALHGLEVFGQKMTVEGSTSEVRRNPGMGGADRCFRCGSSGHWSKICPEATPNLRRRRPGLRHMRVERFLGTRRGPYPPPNYGYDPYDSYDPYYDNHHYRPAPYPIRRSPPESYFPHRTPDYRPDEYRIPPDYTTDYYGEPPMEYRDYNSLPNAPYYNVAPFRRYPAASPAGRYPSRQLPRAYGGSGRMSPARRM